MISKWITSPSFKTKKVTKKTKDNNREEEEMIREGQGI
jgi:hypothetical protein